MKTLIESTIKINGIGRPDTKTIFTITNDREKEDILYRSLDRISGRKLSVKFKYDDNGTEKESSTQLSIPFGLDEEQVKSFIITTCTNRL